MKDLSLGQKPAEDKTSATGSGFGTKAADTPHSLKAEKPAGLEDAKTVKPATDDAKTVKPATDDVKTVKPAVEDAQTAKPATASAAASKLDDIGVSSETKDNHPAVAHAVHGVVESATVPATAHLEEHPVFEPTREV